MMKRLLVIALLLIVVINSQAQLKKQPTSPQEQVCRNMIAYLTSDNYEKATALMDDTVFDKIPRDSVKIAIAGISRTIKNEFNGAINKVVFLASEKTITNDRAAAFIIFKLESKTKFGFYYFYLNEETNKVMLISKFSKIEPKRN